MISNWIAHLNGYRERRKRKPLNANEIALYYILMEYCNELGWMDWFNVSNGVAQGLSGLSRTAFHVARSELARKGYIQYKEGSGNRSGKYLIVDFGTQTRTQTSTQCGTQTEHKPGRKSEPLNKQKPKTETEKDILTDIQKEPEWDSFVKMRKQIKATMTDRAVKLALTELEKLAPGDTQLQKKILDQSTFHCWKGLFPLKGDSRNGTDRQPRSTSATSAGSSSRARPRYGHVAGTTPGGNMPQDE